MADPNQRPFFVGYRGIPRGLRLFLLLVAGVLVAGFAGLGLAIGVTQDDPGDGAFRYDWGRQTLRGRLALAPYPVLYLSEDSKHLPKGSAVLLSGVGKRGVQGRAAGLDGRLVAASGIIVKRGALEMLQVGGGAKNLAAVDGPLPSIDVESLGRWRLTGEICDGKCTAGAMRPGRGISHRACANLCIAGGVPPVFVSTASVRGNTFLLLANEQGQALGQIALAHAAQYVELEGEIERRAALLVFKVTSDTLKLVR